MIGPASLMFEITLGDISTGLLLLRNGRAVVNDILGDFKKMPPRQKRKQLLLHWYVCNLRFGESIQKKDKKPCFGDELKYQKFVDLVCFSEPKRKRRLEKKEGQSQPQYSCLGT